MLYLFGKWPITSNQFDFLNLYLHVGSSLSRPNLNEVGKVSTEHRFDAKDSSNLAAEIITTSIFLFVKLSF